MATTISDVSKSTVTESAGSANLASRKKRHWLQIFSIILAVLGLADSTYLTYSKITDTLTACPANATFSCDMVQHSFYSQIAGLPIVYLGFFGYLAILIVLILDGRVPFFTQRGALIVFGLTLGGFLYSSFLTATEAFTLHKWCLWCLGSAIAMTLLFVLSALRAWRQFSIIDDDELMIDDEE